MTKEQLREYCINPKYQVGDWEQYCINIKDIVLGICNWIDSLSDYERHILTSENIKKVFLS